MQLGTRIIRVEKGKKVVASILFLMLFCYYGDSIYDSMTSKVASQDALPVGFVASHLYMPASRCLQLLMMRVETPKTFEMEYLLLRLIGSPFFNQLTAGSGFPANATENLACLRSLTNIGFMGMDNSHGRLKSILVRFGMSAI